MNPKIELEKAFQIVQASAPEIKSYFESVKIVAGLLSAKKEEKVLTQESILSSIDKTTEDMKKGLKSSL